MRRTLPLALLLLGIAALPCTAHASGLKVRSVSAPRSATVGLPVSVDVRVARAGRTRAAKVSFYLSTDPKHGRQDVQLKSDAKVGKGRRSGAARIAAEPRIPDAQAPGAYRLIACVGKSCRAAKGALQVTAEPVGTPALVEQAVAAHRITPQQGLVYRVFATFGDRRLPAAYAGDDAEPEDTVMRDVAESWPQLSSAQRKQLRPFFLPPAARGSWASRTAGASRGGPVAAPSTCDSNQLANRNWRTLAMPNGHVRVWWLKIDEDRIGPRARSFVTEIENHMWPRLVAIFGREPLRDGGQHCFHGLDDKLDIYMLRLDRKIATTEPYPPRCAGTPAFIVFNAEPHMPERWEVAHELMHAFQFAYRYHDSCADHNKWDEAVANWAAAYLYPKDDDEHYFPWFMRNPEDSLLDASYDGWVFPYAMQQLHGTGTLRAIYDQTERLDLLDAINAGLPGGFKKAWPEFALAAWNQDPVSPNFLEWDRFPVAPEANGKPIAAERLDPGPAGQTRVDVPLGLKPLSRAYRRFKLGPGVTQITIENPSYPDLTVQALVHTPGGGWKTEDWFQRQPVWCPQQAKDRPDEIILVISNNSFTVPSPGAVPLKLVATNIGCSRYVGEASGTAAYDAGTTKTDESWTATGLVYSRILDDGIEVPRFLFNLTAGSVTWSMSGTEGSCSVKAGPVTVPIRNGQLDIRSATQPDATWARRYFANTFGVGPIEGTMTCPNSGTSTRYFSPRASILATSGLNDMDTVSPDGGLEGTSTPWQGSNVSATYKWHLVPDG